MARQFNRANSEIMTFTAGGVGAETTTNGYTMAIAVLPNVYPSYAPPRRSMMGAWMNPAPDFSQHRSRLSLNEYNSAPYYQETNGGIDADGTGFAHIFEDGWTIGAVTRVGVTTSATFYKFVFATGVWSSVSPTWFGSSGGGSAVGTTGQYAIGGEPTVTPDAFFDGHIAAAAIWHRTLSLGELQRLPRGLWSMTGPKFLTEFPSGRDNPASGKEISTSGMRVSTVIGTARGTIPDPPGFRFSPLNRRR